MEQGSATLKIGTMAQVDKYWNVLQTGLLVLWVRFLLRLTSLPIVLNQLSRGSKMGNPDDAEMKKMAYYVDRWLQLFPYNQKGNCFPRSLALYRLARRRGFPVRFHCGIRKGTSGLEGHAWLTLESKTFHEPGMFWRDFTVTFSYPPGRQAYNQWDPTTKY